MSIIGDHYREQTQQWYNDWCKKTGRNGGVLIGSSIRELLNSAAQQFQTDGWTKVEVGGIMPRGDVLGFSKMGKFAITFDDGHGTLDVYPLSNEDDYFTHYMKLPAPPGEGKASNK